MCKSSRCVTYCLQLKFALLGVEVQAQVQLVPQGTESVNGSSVDIGCTSPLVDSGGVMMCGSQSYLVDGCFPDIDTSTSDWASQLVTVRRNEGTAAIGFAHVLLTFGFDTAVSLTGIEMDLFNCPDWNIGIPRIAVYLNPDYNLAATTDMLNSLTFVFGNVDSLQPSCDSLSTVTISGGSFQSGSYRTVYILVDLSHTSSIQWVHIGDVKFNYQNAAGNRESNCRSVFQSASISVATTTSSCLDSTESCVINPSSTIFPSSKREKFPTDISAPGSPDDNSNNGLVIGLSVSISLFIILCLAAVAVIAVVAWFLIKSRNKKTGYSDADMETWHSNGVAVDSSMEYREENAEIKNEDYPMNHLGAVHEQGEPPNYNDLRSPMYNPSFVDHVENLSDNVYDEVPREDDAPKVDLEALYDETDYDDVEPSNFSASLRVAYSAQSRADNQSFEQSTSHVYSHVVKNTPAVPQKSNDLVKYLAVRSAKDRQPGLSTDPSGKRAARHESLSSRSQLAYNPVYQESREAMSMSLETHKLLDNTTGEEMYDRPTIHRAVPHANVHNGFITEEGDTPQPSAPVISEPIQPSDFTGGYQGEGLEDPHIYAPVYAVPNKTPEVPKPVVIANDNIIEKKELGMGQFGRVVLAATNGLSMKDMKLSETDDNKNVSILVAVKRLAAKPSMEDRQVFEKEVKLMSCLKHQNVVSLLGVCYQDPAFIMMEYMEEGDLNNFLKRYSEIVPIITKSSHTQITTSTLVFMASQIASAMQYLASHNYIHRDLASRNCLVGENFVVKLADFGMSRSLYQSHYYRIQGNAILPIRWMATESFFGVFSEKTDVWAFGVTVWELFTLAKQDPYSQFTDTEMVTDAIKGVHRKILERPPSCPKSLYKIMQQCWVIDPKARANFRVVEEMLQTYWYTPDSSL